MNSPSLAAGLPFAHAGCGVGTVLCVEVGHDQACLAAGGVRRGDPFFTGLGWAAGRSDRNAPGAQSVIDALTQSGGGQQVLLLLQQHAVMAHRLLRIAPSGGAHAGKIRHQ